MPTPISREEAQELLRSWVDSESLRRHCLAVSIACEAYAERFGGDPEQWAVTGLLHDADYEKHPEMDDEQDGHPRTIMRVLRERDADPAVVDAIAGHAPYLGVPRESDLAKVLFAVDELSGFLVACAQVRPEGLIGLTPKSVKKKLKQPSFAAAVNRDEVREGAEELGVDFDEHVRFVAGALEARAEELGLTGSTPAAGSGAPAAP